jgi:hypothetical protein
MMYPIGYEAIQVECVNEKQSSGAKKRERAGEDFIGLLRAAEISCGKGAKLRLNFVMTRLGRESPRRNAKANFRLLSPRTRKYRMSQAFSNISDSARNTLLKVCFAEIYLIGSFAKSFGVNSFLLMNGNGHDLEA